MRNPWKHGRLNLVIECCRCIVARDDNAGSFPNGIPDCFYEYMRKFLPHVEGQTLWLMIVESAVKSDAAELVAELDPT